MAVMRSVALSALRKARHGRRPRAAQPRMPSKAPKPAASVGVTQPENMAVMITPKRRATSATGGRAARRLAREPRRPAGAQPGWRQRIALTIRIRASVSSRPGTRTPAKSWPMLTPV